MRDQLSLVAARVDLKADRTSHGMQVLAAYPESAGQEAL
jgi:hypothetical protein